MYVSCVCHVCVMCVSRVCVWTVIDHLDILKKERGGAREGIRWLEAEFRKGNRCVSVLAM